MASASYKWDGGHDTLGWSAPAKTMYFAEGTTRNGFEEYLILRNPGLTASQVYINYLFTSGAPRMQHLRLEAGAGTSILVNDFVGYGKDVSIALTADPGIIAERETYFNYKGVWTGGHVTCGVPSPEDTWYFAEGTTRAGFQEWLCLQNPGKKDVPATITYMLGTGETRDENVTVPASSRKTVDVNNSIGAGQDVSIKVKAARPIVAELRLQECLEGRPHRYGSFLARDYLGFRRRHDSRGVRRVALYREPGPGHQGESRVHVPRPAAAGARLRSESARTHYHLRQPGGRPRKGRLYQGNLGQRYPL